MKLAAAVLPNSYRPKQTRRRNRGMGHNIRRKRASSRCWKDERLRFSVGLPSLDVGGKRT